MRIAIASSSSAPSTMRSGRRKSSTALPSRRNSGFATTEQRCCSLPLSAMAASIVRLTRSVVRTGTVLFVTTTL